jgi:glycerol uptake facilitator-like aquaporin
MIDLGIRLAAEFLGTVLFVLTIIATGGSSVFTGAVLAIIIFLIGNVSGGHVNPAVSLSMFLSGSISASTFIGYTIVQLLGAVTAVYAYKATVA